MEDRSCASSANGIAAGNGAKLKKMPKEGSTMGLKRNVGPSRRTVIKGIGAGAAASVIAAPWVARAAGTIKVGVVAPQTGPLAPFGATDAWTIDQVRKLLADGLDTSAGKYNVEILVQDG